MTGCVGTRVLGVRYDTAVFYGLAPQVVYGARGPFVVPGLPGHSSTSCLAVDAAPKAFGLSIHPTQSWLHLPSLQVSHTLSLVTQATGMASPCVCLSIRMAGFTRQGANAFPVIDDNQLLLIHSHHTDTAAHGPQVKLSHGACNVLHRHGAQDHAFA